MKKWLKVLLILMSVFVVLFTAGAVTLYVMFPPEEMKNLAVTHLEKALGREIQVEKVGFTIFPVLGVSLSNVEIAETHREGFTSEQPFIKFNRFLIAISVRSIFKGYPEITSVVLESPQIVLEVDGTGAFNYEDLKVITAAERIDEVKETEPVEGELAGLPVPVSLQRLTIRDGVILYIDQAESRMVHIGELQKELVLSIDRNLTDITTTGSLLLDKISVEAKEIVTPLSDLSFTFAYDLGINLIEGHLDVNDAKLSLQKIFFNISGTVANFNKIPAIDLVVSSDPFNITDVISEVPLEFFPDKNKLTASGTVHVNVALKGVLEENEPLPLEGRIVFSDGMVRYTDLPKSISQINSVIDFTDSSLQISETAFLFGENHIELGTLISDFEKPYVDGFFKGVIDLMDLQDMIDVPPGASLSGVINADIRGKGEVDPEDPTKLDLTGMVELIDLNVNWSPLAKPAIVNGAFTLSSKAIGEKMSVTIGASSLTMEATIVDYLSLVLDNNDNKFPRPKVDFALTSPLLNVDEILLPEQASEESGVAQAQDTPLIAPLPGVDMRGTVRATRIIFEGLEMNNLNMSVNVVNDVADINFATGFSGGQINSVLKADLRKQGHVSFDNNLTVSNVQVNDLLAGFGDLIPPTTALNRELRSIQNSLFGKINLTSKMGGNGSTEEEIVQSLDGTIGLKVTDGHIANALILDRITGVLERFVAIDNFNFRELNADMRISDGNLIIDDMKAFTGVGDWTASGNVGFDNQLNVTVANRLPKRSSSTLLSVQSKGKDALRGLLSGTALAGASNLVDDIGVPSDRDGRVTVNLNLRGTVEDPQVAFAGFAPGDGAPSQQQPSVRGSVTERARETIDKQRQQLESRAREEKERVQEQVREAIQEKAPVTEEQKERITEQKKEAQEQIKRGTERLRKLF